MSEFEVQDLRRKLLRRLFKTLMNSELVISRKPCRQDKKLG